MSSLEQDFIKHYNQHSDAIFRHCYFRVYDRETALDLVQETFTKTWAYLAEGNNIKNIRAFLYRTATNLIIDRSRKAPVDSLQQLQDQGFEPPTDSKTKIEASIDLAILLKVIGRLDVIYQEVIRLRYIDGLKPREIAEIMGESANVISVRLHRGLAQLEILLSHERPETKKT